MVFRILRFKQGIEQPAFLGREPLKERQGLRWVVFMRSYVCGTNHHFLNSKIYRVVHGENNLPRMHRFFFSISGVRFGVIILNKHVNENVHIY